MAIPERRPKKLSAVRSPVRIGRNGPVTSITVMPASSTLPSSACQIKRQRGVQLPEGLGGTGPAGQHPGLAGPQREVRHGPLGNERGGQIALGREVLGQRPA